jgi:hypothetical protein
MMPMSLQRGLETLSIIFFELTFLQSIHLTGLFLFFYLLFYTKFYFLSLLYVVWYVIDFKRPFQGGRPSKWAQNWTVWKWVRDYYPIELVKTAELDASKNYIMGVGPHGIMCFSAMTNFGTEATGFSHKFPGLTRHLMALQLLFYPPLGREYVMTSGTCPVSKDSIKYILNNRGQCKEKGQVCVILIGGAKYKAYFYIEFSFEFSSSSKINIVLCYLNKKRISRSLSGHV